MLDVGRSSFLHGVTLARRPGQPHLKKNCFTFLLLILILLLISSFLNEKAGLRLRARLRLRRKSYSRLKCDSPGQSPLQG
jgi:hypothetical protein